MGWLTEALENGALIRRIFLLWGMAMTTYALQWTFTFVEVSKFNGIETAAIIGAIWVPLSSLQGYLFGAYTKARQT